MSTVTWIKRALLLLAAKAITATDHSVSSHLVEKAYIVSLRDTGSSGQFHKRAADLDVDYSLRREFHGLFNGLSVTLSNEGDVERLVALPEVDKVWPVTEISAPIPALSNAQIETARATSLANRNVTRGRDYKIDYNLKLAGIEHLHKRGIKGKGVRLAVIDTGVDYNHPALGGGFGPGKKISFGRSYVEGDDPKNPLATCITGGHGSHVAGKMSLFIALPEDTTRDTPP